MTTIDEGLYSRQLYAIGKDAMEKMVKSNVIISNMNGLGLEIAKNTILQGCNKVTLHDTKNITNDDLSTNYYITSQDIGKNRAVATYSKLAELNSYVKVDVLTRPLTIEFMKNYNVVVLVDYDLKRQIEFNEFTHKNNIKFISTTTMGLMGQVFCDFCDNFIVHDSDGEQIHGTIVENIMNDKEPLVTCIDSKPHGLMNGDMVRFIDLKGMTELDSIPSLEVKYIDKNSFKLMNVDTTKFGKFISGEVIQVKQPKYLNFKSIKESIETPEFVMTDFSDFEKPNKLHAFFRCQEYLNNYLLFKTKVKELCSTITDEFIDKFYHTYKGRLVPMNSIFGGMISQEILKACSGKFTPINQWLYYDAFDCLPENYKMLNRTLDNSRYDSQIMVFGNDLQQKLLSMKYFIVGSGAIGCELLKNFAMIGIGCGKDGKIYLTDMDTIERSNLNRQFLFRNKDIGKSKSEAAANTIRQMNPDINIVSHLNKVGTDTENVYDMAFFNSLDGVANALDNVQARLYVDQRCILFKKSLLESGTLGTKGNVQVIVPHLTESYGSSQDPPEANIPVCTIKTFPNELSHTVQWSREQFEELFFQKPKDAIDYLTNPKKIQEMSSSDIITFSENVKFILNNIPVCFDDCIKMAFNQWYEYYNYQIKNLIEKFPSNAKTSTGSPFWSGAKKCPHIIEFDKDNRLHLDYIIAFANLWANIFKIKGSQNDNYIQSTLSTFSKPTKYSSCNIKISLTDEEEKKRLEEERTKMIDIDEIVKSLPEPKKFSKLVLQPQEFEKDDDTNFHIDFITAASNMRADNYDIKLGDRHSIKGIAGKIIPALSSTTSVVAGLVTMELYKLAQGFNKIENYRNTFLNLALPYFGFSEPIATPKTKINDRDYTMWDTFIIQGDKTLQEFLDKFETDYKLELETITYGDATLYGLILSPMKLNKRLNMKIRDIIEGELGIKINTNSISLQIYASSDDEDIELPEVLYIF